MASKPSKPHDEFFKATFGRLDIAYDYLVQFLPEAVIRELDLKGLERVNGSFVDPNLSEHHSDVVFKCPLAQDADIFVWITFILEHKSRVEQRPHLQLLRYMLGVWDQQLKTENNERLSLLIPIVVYHGEQKWHQRDLAEYFDVAVPESLLPYLPRFNYLLTNVQDLSPEQINELNKGLLINTLFMLKYIWDTNFILDHSELFVANLSSSRSHINFVTSLLVYLFKSSEISSEKAHQFIQKLPSSLNDNAMSTYDLIVKEGVEIGIQQGLKQGIQQGIEQGIEKGIEQGIEQGIEKGIEQGIEKGIEQGIEQTLRKSTLEMLNSGLEEELIIKFLQVDQAFIDQVKAEIQMD